MNDTVRTLVYYELPRTVQDRFALCTQGREIPTPLLYEAKGTRHIPTLLGVSALGVALTLALFFFGYGDPFSALSRHGPAWLMGYGALGLMITAPLAFAAGRAAKLDALPYPRGLYVFAGNAVDARTWDLRVYPRKALSKVERTGDAALALAYEGGHTFIIRAKSAKDADTVAESLRMQAAPDAGATSSTMAAIDPLFEGIAQSPLLSMMPPPSEQPNLARRGPIVAACIALVWAGLGWSLRNMLSDRAMVRRAVEADNIDTYRAYLQRGGKREVEVRDILLARAELRMAESAGTRAVVVFREAHPKSPIAGEIDAALRRTLLRELETVAAKRSLAELRAFEKGAPPGFVENELSSAKHAHFTEALSRYKNLAPSPAIAPVEKLLSTLEAKGPSLRVLFVRRPSRTLGKADESVTHSAFFGGMASLPKALIERERSELEEEAFSSLSKSLAHAFASDLLLPEKEKSVSDPPPAFQTATLVVDYSFEWSNTAVAATRPFGTFVGVNLPFEVRLHLPGANPLTLLKHTIWKNPELWKKRDWPAQGAAKILYDELVESAYHALRERLVTVFFQKPPVER